MAFRIFQYQIPCDPELPELNAFLAAKRVAAIQKEIVSIQGGAMLVFIVEWIESRVEPATKRSSNSRIDYRERLDDDQFALFSKLRDVRKKVADSEGVPVYTVFTNAQLAGMVETRCVSTEQIAKIEGIGSARIQKYSGSILPVLQEAFGKSEGESL